MEQWKDIEGYEGLYQVSNMGRVKSLERKDRIGRDVKERILSEITMPRGYKSVRFKVNGMPSSALIHRLVAKAFIDNVDNKPDVNHIDGNKANNVVANLEWVTKKENTAHAIKIGLIKQNGSQSVNSKLTENKVFCIRSLQSKGMTHQFLADLFNVSRATISLIVERKTWRHI